MEQKSNLLVRIKNWILEHKIWTAIILIVLVFAIYEIVKAATPTTSTTSYVVGTANTGTIVSTVSGTGQVSTSSSLLITPQVSGIITSIQAKPGDHISKGQTIFVLNDQSAQSAVRDAKVNLASAQLALASANVQTNNTASSDATTVSNAYTALLNSGPQAIANDIGTSSYQPPTVSGNYTLGIPGSITVTTYASSGGISFSTSGLVNSFGLTSSITPSPLGNSGLSLIFPGKVVGGLTWTITLPNTGASNYLSNYNAYQAALTAQKQSSDTSGVTAIDLATKQLAVTQAQNSLTDAEQTLADCYVTAPFSGTLASVPVVVGQSVSSGTTLGTAITDQQVANVTLNEVDVAKVALGDKATLTFDAVSGLTITGTVSEIDTVGTVSQGVVNYTVKISLDTSDSRIKSGMSVSANIATAVHQDVVMVPSSAVKTSNGASYVLTVPASTPVSTTTTGQTLATTPTQTTVQVGISDGTDTEITSGISDGDKIVTKTVITTSTATTTAPSATSLLGGSTNRGGSTAGALRGVTGTGR